MNNLFYNFKIWYENRQIREKVLVLFLCWALSYGVFSLIFFRPQDNEKKQLTAEIKDIENKVNNWRTQVNAIKKIPQTSLYKEWLQHKESLKALQGKYSILIDQVPVKKIETVTKAILEPQNNITLVEIKNFPETVYNPSGLTDFSKKIYQQQLLVIVFSNFIDTVNYIEHLEKILPNVHWDSVSYEVAQYPIAKTQMEFSIIYEKN